MWGAASYNITRGGWVGGLACADHKGERWMESVGCWYIVEALFGAVANSCSCSSLWLGGVKIEVMVTGQSMGAVVAEGARS